MSTKWFILPSDFWLRLLLSFLVLVVWANSQSVPLTITSPSPLPNAVFGVPYSHRLEALGGTPPYRWSIAQGALPVTMTLNAATGEIFGTPPQGGFIFYNFSIRVRDSNGVEVVKAFSLTIQSPNGIVGVSYVRFFGVGVPASTCTLGTGSLPPGLAITTSGGACVISGIPTTPGTYSFTLRAVTVTAVTTELSVIIGITPPLSWTTPANLPDGSPGSQYGVRLEVTGGTPPYSWTVLDQALLPPGLAVNHSNGLLSGVPTATGVFNFAVRVVDSNTVYRSSVDRGFKLTIGAAPPPLQITSAGQLPDGHVGTSYTQTLSASGGTPPYRWAVASGMLPPGLSLNPSSGVLSGVPSSPGLWSFAVTATDSAQVAAIQLFELRIEVEIGPRVSAAGIVNAASFQPGPVAPGEIITIFGSGLGPSTLVRFALDATGRIPTSLAGVQVLFDSTPAPVLYASFSQTAALVPFAVDGKTSVVVRLDYRGARSDPIVIPVSQARPAVFTSDASGKGQGAILNEDFRVNSDANPAPRGSVVSIFATGGGQTFPAGMDGRPAADPLPRLILPVTVWIGGVEAEVLYAGSAFGLVEGVIQINARVPAELASGSALPLLVRIGNEMSPAGVTIAVR